MVLGIDCSRYASLQTTGVEVYTNRIVQGMVAKADSFGFAEVRLYVREQRQEEALKALVEKSGQKLVTIRLLPHERFWTLFWLTLELSRNPIDIFFEPSHTLPLIVPKRTVINVHGVEAMFTPEAYSLTQRLHQRFSIWWAKRENAQFIAITEAVKKDLVEFFKIPESRITVIHHGFDPTVEQEPGEEEGKDLIEGEYILNIGRLEIRKNQLRLIEAFEAIAQEYKKIKLVLVGPDGMGADEIRKRVEKSAVKDRIFVAGYLDRAVVERLLKKALIFAFPSLSEGFGMPVLEAFDAGVPVLTSKGHALEEVGGDAAMYCDPKSVDSIAQGLKFYFVDPKLREEKIRLGKKRIEGFSWEKCVGETMKLLHGNL